MQICKFQKLLTQLNVCGVKYVKESCFVCNMYQYQDDKSKQGALQVVLIDEEPISKTFYHSCGILDFINIENGLLFCDSLSNIYNFKIPEIFDDKYYTIDELDPPFENQSNRYVSLSIDYNQNLKFGCITYDSGALSIFDENLKQISFNEKAHEYTCWYGKVGNNGCIYSLSDDCYIKIWSKKCANLVHSIKATKTGGLCLEFLSDEQFLVGSYDNDILIYDMRNLSNPFNVLKISTPTWRMRYNKEFSRLYLACLNAGPTIITLDDNFNITTSLNLSENFSHSSLVYGFDFDNTKTSSHSDDIVSCSFYDNTVCFANILYGV